MSGILVPKPMLGRQLRKGHRSARGLAGYWPFNEGSGNIVSDLSGNGHHGLFEAVYPTWTVGNIGPALHWDVANENIAVPHSPQLQGFKQFSLVLSINNDDTGGSERFFGKTNTYDFQIRHDSSGECYLRVYDEGGVVRGSFIPGFDWGNYSGQYMHAVAVFDGVNAYWYVNGVLFGSVGCVFDNVNTADTSALYLGGGGGGSRDCASDIEYFSLYNRVLNASEIAELYLRPFAMFDREPLPLWTAATQGVVGENFVRTISDSIGLADTESLIKEIYRTFNEPMGVVDAESKIWDSIRIVAESLGIADTFSKEEAKIISESLGITDVASKVSIVLRTLVESLGLTDGIALQRFMTVSDDLGITDAIALQRVMIIADTLGITDDVARLVNYLRTKTDDMGLLDSMVRVSLVLRTIDDDMGITDEASAQLGALLKAVWAFVIMRQTHK